MDHGPDGLKGPWMVLSDHPFSPWGQKIKLAQKIMQVEVDKVCMRTKFSGCGLFSVLKILLLFVFLQISLLNSGL